jgi:hypothetical protein
VLAQTAYALLSGVDEADMAQTASQRPNFSGGRQRLKKLGITSSDEAHPCCSSGRSPPLDETAFGPLVHFYRSEPVGFFILLSPLCDAELRASRLKSEHPKEINSLGDHTRTRRLDLKLLQRQGLP